MASMQVARRWLRSTAFSSLGLVLTICAGFFLMAWWIKHFRDTRRARKLVDADEVERVREHHDEPVRT